MKMRTVATLALALAFAAPTAAQDYAAIKVLDMTRIELPSGPGDTSVILSPDGSRVLSIAQREMCLFAPAQVGPWAKLKCVDKTADSRIRGPSDMRWSPDSKALLMPTYMEALVMFRDTDITVFDPDTFVTTVLTDDGVRDGLMNNRQPADFDLSARWVDEDTIAFFRYAVPAGGLTGREGPWVMTVNTDGSTAKQASKVIIPQGYVLYALAISPDGRRYAHPIEIPDDPENAGIYIAEFGGAPRRLASVEGFGKGLSGIQFSADGKYLMVLGSSDDTEGNQIVHVIDAESGEIIRIAPDQPLAGAAWAPTGSALAYIVRDRENANNPGGLFAASAPGEPGRLLVGGLFNASTCCTNEPFVWASNDTMILGNAEDASITVTYVQLGW